MAIVEVVRQVVDTSNQLSWAIFQIDDSQLLAGEVPAIQQTIGDDPQPPTPDQTPISQ